MSSGHARRAKIRSRTKAFGAIANRASIERNEVEIIARFLTEPPCHRSQREVQKRLLRWVSPVLWASH
jgi:hypothetical protein